jgi:hypothetical protein
MKGNKLAPAEQTLSDIRNDFEGINTKNIN